MMAQATTCIENSTSSCMFQSLKCLQSMLRLQSCGGNSHVHVQNPPLIVQLSHSAGHEGFSRQAELAMLALHSQLHCRPNFMDGWPDLTEMKKLFSLRKVLCSFVEDKILDAILNNGTDSMRDCSKPLEQMSNTIWQYASKIHIWHILIRTRINLTTCSRHFAPFVR